MPHIDTYDLVIIGGGINGVGIARDAAGRGLSVALCEMGDLGQATSSNSSKLIHGGLRYLEQYQFRLVSECLREREILLKAAPHIVWPLEFILPSNRTIRAEWKVKLGLWLYDWLASHSSLPRSEPVELEKHPGGQLLDPHFTSGFSYADCWVQDARLVVLNAMDAKSKGAHIFTRMRCHRAVREDHLWRLDLDATDSTETRVIRGRSLINAAGPWAANLLHSGIETRKKERVPLKLVKGSHMVIKALGKQDHAYLFQHIDKRVVFMLPFEGEYTLIGTTEVVHDGSPTDAAASDEEISYLCDVAGRYLLKPITPDQVIWKYAGVRALYNPKGYSMRTTPRDYVLEREQPSGKAPLLNVFGGKITTYRALAEAALSELSDTLPAVRGKEWTATAVLPGGNIKHGTFEDYLKKIRTNYAWLPAELAYRYARNYGTLLEEFMGEAKSIEDLGRHIGAGLYAAEVDYLVTREFARTAEDILWRRTKCGLQASRSDWNALEEYLAETAYNQDAA